MAGPCSFSHALGGYISHIHLSAACSAVQEHQQPLARIHPAEGDAVTAPKTSQRPKHHPGRRAGQSRRSLEKALRRRIAPCPIEVSPHHDGDVSHTGIHEQHQATCPAVQERILSLK